MNFNKIKRMRNMNRVVMALAMLVMAWGDSVYQSSIFTYPDLATATAEVGDLPSGAVVQVANGGLYHVEGGALVATASGDMAEGYDDTAITGRVETLENAPDADTVYDDSVISGRVAVLESAPDNDTIYDDTVLTGRVDTLENTPDNDTIYDDSAVIGRLDVLEATPDTDTVYDDSLVIGRLDVIEATPDNDTIYDDAAITGRVETLENTPDNDTVYDDSAITGRVATLENAPAVAVYDDSLLIGRIALIEAGVDNDTVYDDTAITGRVETLENTPDNDTIYDDTALSGRVETLENAPDNDTIYDDSAVIGRLDVIEATPDNDTVYDDSAITGRVETLEDTPDNDTIYNDSAVMERLDGLANDLINIDETILPMDGDRVYLDPIHGSDVTASVNSPMRPYRTWEAAVLGATDNSTIICAQGVVEITGGINRDQVSIYGPQTDFVRGAGWDGFLLDVESPAINDGSKFIIANSITGQNILRTGTRHTYFKANRVHLIDEGLEDNSSEESVNPNSSDVVCLISGTSVEGSDIIEVVLDIGHLSSDLLGSASPTPQVFVNRTGSSNNELIISGSIGYCSNINFRKIGVFSVSLDLSVRGDIINDSIGFKGGLLGETLQIARSVYDYFRLQVGGKVSSLCGVGCAVIKTNLGEWSVSATGGIESLDDEPAIWVSDSEINSFGSSKTYIRAPFATSGGSPLRIANNDRDAIYDGIHFTSSSSSSLIFPDLLQGGNSPSTHLFKECSTDLTANGGYLLSGGIIDFDSMQNAAGFSNAEISNNNLSGSISLIEGYSASFISQFNY